MALEFSTPALPFRHPATLVATFGGAGLFPKAPGTIGSLAAIPPALMIHWLGGACMLFIAALAAAGLGWWACQLYLPARGEEDPSEVVIDEVAAIWLTLACLPWTPIAIVLGFALFRLLDIRKPWPIGWCDTHIKGSLGVMLDDLVAAVITILILWVSSPFWGG